MPHWVIFLAISVLVLVGGGALMVLLLGFLLRRLGRKIIKEVGGDLRQFQPPPARIHLTPAPFSFGDPKGDQFAAGFAALGYTPAGQYAVTEMAGVKLHVLVSPGDSAYAILYDHPRAGIWVELTSRTADGHIFSTSTMPDTGLDRPPHRISAGLEPTAEPAAILAKLREIRPADAVYVRVSAEDFVATFQYNYAEDMDWRIDRGGPTDDEIRRVAAKQNLPVTPAGLAAVHARWAALKEESREPRAAEPLQ